MFPYINNILRDVTATNLLGTLARQNLTALYRIVEYRSSPVCYLQVALLANFHFPPLSLSLSSLHIYKSICTSLQKCAEPALGDKKIRWQPFQTNLTKY